MVKVEKIFDEDGKGFTLATTAEDVEKVDPLTYYRTVFIENKKAKYREVLRLKNKVFKMEELEPVVEKHATADWEEMHKALMEEKVPDFLFSTLKTDSRKYQEKFLRGMAFTPEQLAAFYIRAGEMGYTLSTYSTEHLPTGTNISDMPRLAHVDGEKISKVGETVLKDGEIKQAILQRSAIYGKILDKGDEWHCFFITIESIAGKENWENGQPHYHYISDKFGVPREEVVRQLKNKDYRLFNLPHLKLLDYKR